MGSMVAREGTEVRRCSLGELLAGIADGALSAAERGRVVTGLFDDSRLVKPGSVFVAVCGTRADGRAFVADALRRGASVLIGEGLERAAGALVINVDDARAALARLAARWWGLDRPPASAVRLLGVTGTNGKTTVAYMTRAILQAAGLRCALLGTVEYDLCDGEVRPADMTTPGPLELAEKIARCVAAGAQAVVMEVSSHALAQRRTDGLRFAAAAFTNLTQDHLDYHGTLAAYLEAKARLFARLDGAALAVINRDDASAEAVLRRCRARVLGYGLERAAELTASVVSETLSATQYRLRLGGGELSVTQRLVGRHNVYNALAAAGLARALEVPHEAIGRGLSGLPGVPGRLQRVPCLRQIDVFVDYAHTDDALRNVTGVLRPLTRGRLIVVFGCGGERDRTKRPLMARAAAAQADLVIVTSDNPRSEDPQAIIAEALKGLAAGPQPRVIVEPDRRLAIGIALREARPGDLVLIAGKGHEKYQVIGQERLPFDDVEVARAAAEELAGGGCTGA